MEPQPSSFAVPNGGLAVWDGKDGVVQLHLPVLSLSLTPGFISVSNFFPKSTQCYWLGERESFLGVDPLLGRGKRLSLSLDEGEAALKPLGSWEVRSYGLDLVKAK